MKFEELNLDSRIKENLKDLDYFRTTKVQENVIPIFQENKDVLVIAQTGTGKTAAFSLPIIDNLMKNKEEILNKNSPFVLILAPTRELCNQISFNIKEYSKNTIIETLNLHGGEDFQEQIKRIKNKKYHILIGTVNRITDLLKNEIINLNKTKYLIIDEFDKILEENFNSNLKYLKKKISRKIQSGFFSATINDKIEEIADYILKDKVKIQIEEEMNLNLIEQNVLYVQKENKYKLLLELLNKKEVKSAIIFVNSKLTGDELVRFLRNNNILSEAIHSGKSNTHRTKVINNIKSRKIKLLIATDLASRGLDIENISHIINFDIPTSTESYIHRIGRTARAGQKGIALSLCSSTERNFIKKIENNQKIKLKIITHQYHSEFALKAKGKDSKPKFKSKKNNFGKNKKKSKFPVRSI